MSHDAQTMAQLLADHPAAARALNASIERQATRKQQAHRPAAHVCPHCGSDGAVYLTLGEREYRRRRADCCQSALRDAALNALRYAMNPKGEPNERLENADLYAALKATITAPELLEELDAQEGVLAEVEARVSSLTTSQGGVA